MRSYHDYTFVHSVDVAVVSIVIGLASGYDRPRLRELGAGALLHDVGKVKIPTEILDKRESLTTQEFERVKLHTTLGYQIISQSREFSYVSAHAALEHHERLDGSGYPRRLRGDKIHEIGKIVAVADVFCAMTSDRVYRRKVPPQEGIRHMRAAASKFDQRFVRRLALRVAAFPNGTFVRLSTGEFAVVVRQDPRNSERPVVRLLADAGNRPVEQVEVALADTPELDVALVLDDMPEQVRQALASTGGDG
ncbi:MAG: HD-GYP domain-containing protein [Bacillota bacterium]